jgi:hypothetical protein
MEVQLMLFALVAVATAEPELIFRHSTGKACSMEYDGAELATATASPASSPSASVLCLGSLCLRAVC